MINRFLSLGLGLCLLGMLAGCGQAVRKSDLPGTYVADYVFAKETLDMTEDGHFTQTVAVKATGKVVVAHGTWEFDPKAQYLRFSEEFLVVVDGYGAMIPNFDHPKERGLSVLPVMVVLGKLEIGGDPGITYQKQANRQHRSRARP